MQGAARSHILHCWLCPKVTSYLEEVDVVGREELLEVGRHLPRLGGARDVIVQQRLENEALTLVDQRDLCRGKCAG